MYDHARYFTVTGRLVGPQAVADCQAALDALHAKIFGAKSARQSDGQNTNGRPTDAEILELFSRCDHSEKFLRLMSGDTTGYKSASEADSALACKLAWATRCPEQIARLMRQSGLNRAKLSRDDYINRTINAALKLVSDPYDWSRADPLSNAKMVEAEDKDGNTKTVAVPLTMREVLADIRERTGDWPRRVDNALFIDAAPGVHWLDNPPALFGYLSSRCGKVKWHGGVGFVSRAEVYEELRRQGTSYVAIEEMPHEPKIAGHYYACSFPAPGDGKHLAKLLDYFRLKTDLDRQLLQAAYATPLWGGPAGTRPAFLLTAPAGRGKGKSKAAQFLALLYGGPVDVSPKEDASKIKTRLLTPEALPRRVAVLDNVKTSRFSWGELEAMITNSIIGGHRMYRGEATRPNYITWIITLNGASLSTDMAQRIVEIQLAEPGYASGWEDEVRGFIDQHRGEIIGDLIGFLRRKPRQWRRRTRWATWEGEVLARVDSPAECLNLIVERRGAVDVEEEEGAILEDFFQGKLRWLEYDVEHDDVFVPNPLAARWFNEATGDRLKTSAVTRAVKQAFDEGRLQNLVPARLGGSGARGLRWIGEHAVAEDTIKTDIRARLARKRESEHKESSQDSPF
jgi:hypothetical protein